MKSLTEKMSIVDRLAQLKQEQRDLEEMRDQFDFEHRRDNDGIDEVEGVVTMSMLA